MERRRGWRETEVTKRRIGGIDRGKSNLAVINFLFPLHSLEHSERFMEFNREEEGGRR